MVLKTQLFNDLITLYFTQGNKIEDEQIIERIAKDGLGGATPERRKSTVKSWINWIIKNLMP
jgi:hypothetical protein